MSEENRDDKSPFWADAVKEITATGLAAFFMTEDSVRNYIKEKKFPKEIAGLLIDGLSKKKDDLYNVVAKEIGKMFSKVDVTAEMSKFLERHKIHLEAKVSFEPKSDKSEET